jgi:hypothetical protein
MSTLILQAAGSVVGAAVGGPVGALVGRSVGALAGAALDSRLFASKHQVRYVEGPRLKTVSGLSSTEGAPIPRVYGRARLGGEIIWATRFLEQVTYETSGGERRRGGKGGGGGGGSVVTPVTVTTVYTYYANFAVGLCEGQVAAVRRIWADGVELDLTAVNHRFYRGTDEQQPDPLIVAKEGSANAPAYRGIAYVVFEMLPLAPYGNRLPQLSFEVVRPVSRLAAGLRAVQLIPGAGEFVYGPAPVGAAPGAASSAPLNRHQLVASTDWQASLDVLQASCPRLERVGLVVSWFGDDLRAGSCSIRPKPETNLARARPDWRVAGLTRYAAQPLSSYAGRPAFGGTPSDASVIAAIRDLKARGLQVTLYPFVLMDIPSGNMLPDPWTGGVGQPAYPWRGKITGSRAPGVAGSPDLTPQAAVEIASLFGQASPGNFSVQGDRVLYSGNPEWTLRRQVLHCAALALAAGGVDSLLIGSEFLGLTRLRDRAGHYPAVDQLVRLAADVRSMLGSQVKLAYAADWVEYGSHVPAPGELRFPLDPLWASPAIDAVAIDAWWPLSDWRDGGGHRDAAAARSAADPVYLLANVAAGENFDWYYADDVGREGQVRLPITDGAYGKPFVYRPKDLFGWWSNPHAERVGGVELSEPTAWVPGSKPIWLNEVGCPAVDKGANRPSTFPDPKSVEGGLPPYSNGLRDDLMLHRGVQAMLSRFDPSQPDHPPGANPVASVAGGRMVDPARIHVWAWDARPFPAFPMLGGVWADSSSWATGHWLTGRLEGAPADDIVRAILADMGAPAADRIEVDGYLDGYVVDRPMSVREALEPLAGLFGFDCLASAGQFRFRDRLGSSVLALGTDDLVPRRDGEPWQLTRHQDSELPYEISLAFSDAEFDYARATASSRRLAGASRRLKTVEVGAVLRRAEAGRLADIALHDAWAARETLTCQVRPGLIRLEPGDLVSLADMSEPRIYRIERIRDAEVRELEASAVEPAMYAAAARAASLPSAAAPALAGPPRLEIVDWPFPQGDPALLQSLAVSADPWPGQMAVWRSVDGASFDLFGAAPSAAVLGTTLTDLPPGPLWRFDDLASLTVQLDRGALPSASDLTALQGTTCFAVLGAGGQTEVLAFARADLVGSLQWRVTRLIRGLGSSEDMAARATPAGARIVLLNQALVPLARGTDMLGQTWRYRVGPSGRDVGDPAVVEMTATPQAAALSPLAPVGVRARRVAGGVEISWLRRGRVSSDAWEPAEIPLGEETAAFACTIRAQGSPKRMLRAEASPVLYAAADELADFGAPQASLTVSLAQISAVVGAGFPFEGSLPIT